jgi:hypothetical protein
MSALGQKLPRLTQSEVSALPPKAAADVTDPRVRFGPILLQKSVASFFGQ